jgi:acetyl esterase/lipase
MKPSVKYLILLLIISLRVSVEIKAQKSDTSRINNQRYLSYCFENFRTIKDIPFGEVVNHEGVKEELRLDIYMPENDRLLERRLIVWFHGGGFQSGNDKTQRYIVSLCQAFAKKGYVCIAPDYPLRRNPSFDRTGTLNDAI